jgi:tetratricopeptide (TPR) repeat protein
MSRSKGKATKPSPQWTQQMLQLGFKALSENRLKEAGEYCRKVLSTQPELVEGHFLVGLVAREMKDRRTAISAFGSVTKLKPDHAAAYAQLAQIFMQSGQPNRGYEALLKAVEYETGDPLVQSLIGQVYFMLGEQDTSFEWHSKALAQQPDNPAFNVNYANSLVFLGRLDEAKTALGKALQLQPGSPQAHWILSNVDKAKDAAHIDELKTLLQRSNLAAQGKAFLKYGLGKELEDLQQWDDAFEAFSEGASARRTVIEYDEASEAAMFKALEYTFTAEWLEQSASGFDDTSPIFIVGQPRSGTTLVERIITSHSQVHSAGELQQFGIAVRRMLDYRQAKRYSADIARRSADLDMSELGRLYFDMTRKMRGDLPRFVDKLPSNYQNIPLILKALPNAKIIHLVRNPMDACFSSFKQLFADAYPHSYEQQEMARHHARYLHLMSVWRERFPGRFFDVHYEDIARDLEPNARALIDYLELPWEDACLSFHTQSAAVTTASAVQVREPAHTRSIGRWQKYANELAPMRAELEKCGVQIDSAD